MAAEDADEALDIATQAYMDAVNIGGRKGLERTVRAIREYGKRQREKMAVLGVEALSGEVATLQEKLLQAELKFSAEFMRAEKSSELLHKAEAALEAAKERIAEDNAACICGCPAGDHEDYGEEGESCWNPDHECHRACAAVVNLFGSLRAALEAEREAHEKTRESLGGFAELASTSMKRISDLEGALRRLLDGMPGSPREAEALLSRLPEPPA